MTNPEMESRLRELLAQSYPSGEMRFEPGFADRVTSRLESGSLTSNDLASTLARQSRRVIPLLIAASIALALFNWNSTRGQADSALSAALGIRSVSRTSSTLTTLDGAEAFQ